MSARRVTALTLAGMVALGACGPEDIELAASHTAPDAAASHPGPDAAGAEGGGFGTDASAPECDARAPSASCRALGAACGSDSDCCSTHCAGETCALPGTCSAAGTACTSRGECCSGLCEPAAGSTTLVCLPQCAPAGAGCTRASDCCALGCNAGTCTGAECLREGSGCTADVQCCSNECDVDDGGANGKCVIDPIATCRASGDDCHSGGPGTCCPGGVCDNTSGRCDPGPGPCRPIGAVCVSASDCCLGAPCTDDGTGRTVCTSMPLADGVSCVASFECASASCIGDPPVCGAPPATCAVTGAACATASQCCSSLCADGACQPSPCSTPH
jgi:hypothetical protein